MEGIVDAWAEPVFNMTLVPVLEFDWLSSIPTAPGLSSVRTD